MIPVLFDATETQFNNNGHGRLADTISCTVTEALNGEYTLKLVTPIDGLHASEIENKMLLRVQPNETSAEQCFRIVKVTKSSDGRTLTVEANHISYDLSGFPMTYCEAVQIQTLISMFENYCSVQHNFTFESDITSDINFTLKQPKSIRACLGGVEGSLLQRMKCEYEFDNWRVKILKKRGTDNGASIRYGKNLESFVSVKTSESSYDGVVAFYYNPEVYAGAQSSAVMYAEGANFPVHRIFIYDATNEFDDPQSPPTIPQLSEEAAKYIAQNNIGYDSLESVTVKFIPLWQTEEFKDIVGLEQVSMGDTVHVFYDGREYTPRVIEYTYDVLAERYTSITLGDKKSTFSETITQVATEVATDAINRRGEIS